MDGRTGTGNQAGFSLWWLGLTFVSGDFRGARKKLDVRIAARRKGGSLSFIEIGWTSKAVDVEGCSMFTRETLLLHYMDLPEIIHFNPSS